MATKDLKRILDPWKVWPDGVVPAEGNRPEWRLRTPEEGRAWLKGLAEYRKKCRLGVAVSALDTVRRERDER